MTCDIISVEFTASRFFQSTRDHLYVNSTCLLIRHLEFDPIRVLLDRCLPQPGNVLRREQTVGRLVIAQYLARERDLVDLGRPIGESHVKTLDDLLDERHLASGAERAVEM